MNIANTIENVFAIQKIQQKMRTFLYFFISYDDNGHRPEKKKLIHLGNSCFVFGV